MAAMPQSVRRIVGVLTVLLLGLFGVVWVGANPIGGGILLTLSFLRLVVLVRDLRGAAHAEELLARLAQLDKEIAQGEAKPTSTSGDDPQHAEDSDQAREHREQPDP